MSLVVKHDNEGVEAFPVQHGVGAEWTGHSNALFAGGHDRRFDRLDFLATEKSALPACGLSPPTPMLTQLPL